MNSTKSKALRKNGKKFGREFFQVWCGGWQRLWPRLWIILGVVGVGVVLIQFFSETDNSIAAKFWLEKGRARTASEFLSNHADLMLAIPLSVGLWILGAIRRRIRWRKLALACLLATCIAGLLTDVFRGTIGRPRPEAELPDGFYGPPKSFRAKFQSYPSGHATTSTATAVVIAVCIPVTTVPCALYAVSVNISRMQLRKHHPLDVIVGSMIGATSGWCFASAVPGARWRLRRRRKLKNSCADNAKS